MRGAALGIALVAAACLPSFEDRSFLIEETRVLAVRGVPAEARPGAAVSYQALVVSPEGSVAVDPDWAYCVRPRSVEERTGVTASCAAGDDLATIDADATLLADACARFGPNPPPVDGDEAPRRPADPDPTGGYYVPVRARASDAVTFGFHRVRCDLAGATRAIFEAYQDRYTDNQHPAIEAARASDQDLAAGTVEVAPGARVAITVRAAADAAEPYVVYIAEESALFDRTEVLTAHWYVTAGTLSRGSGPLRDGAADSEWTAPSEPGLVHGWIVLGDDRGGQSWVDFRVTVR